MNSSQTSSTSSTKSSTTTSRVAKTSSSQRLHHMSSSSSSSSSSTQSSEMKAMALKRDLNDIKNSMSEISTMATIPQPQSIAEDLKLSNSTNSFDLNRLRSSLENIVDVDEVEEPMVTFPDDNSTTDLELSANQLAQIGSDNELVVGGNHLNTTDTVKFEEKRMMSASKTKVIKDGFSSEQVKFIF